LDHSAGEIFFADNPSGHKVKAAVAGFAFEGAAPGVLIRNFTIEKYTSAARKGAIHSGSRGDMRFSAGTNGVAPGSSKTAA